MDNRSTDMMNDAIDLCSCYEPICEPPVNLLEEWQDSEYAGPEPTLENTSYYVKEPDGMLSEKYQAEQHELDEKIQELQAELDAAVQTAVDAEKWIELMKKYVNPTQLTAELLNALIEKILIHEAVKHEDGTREQEVEIFYRFIGKVE